MRGGISGAEGLLIGPVIAADGHPRKPRQPDGVARTKLKLPSASLVAIKSQTISTILHPYYKLKCEVY